MNFNLELSGEQMILAQSGLVLITLIIIVFIKLLLNYKAQKLISGEKSVVSTKLIRDRVKHRSVDDFSFSKPLLKFGLLISISFALFAFSWTIEERTNEVSAIDNVVLESMEIIPRTTYTPPMAIPPPTSPKFIIEVPNDILLDKSEVLEEELTKDTKLSKDINTSLIAGSNIPAYEPDVVSLKPKVDIDEVFIIVEQMPRFPGCEALEATNSEKKDCADSKMLAYIYSKIKYPKLAIENNIEGTAVVTFTIDKDGSLTSLEIVRDPGGGLGQEALRVIRSMNNLEEKWTPGKQRSRPVKVKFTFPVKFVLGR